MAPPNWMVKAEETATSGISTRISKAKEGPRDKKQKPGQKYVRTRARLPEDKTERAKYDLPSWVADDNFKTMLQVLFKTLANTQQRLRTLESVVADNFVMPSDKPPIAYGLAHAETYHKRALANKGKDGDLGPPAPHVFYAFCDSLLTTMDIGEVQKKGLQDLILDPLKNNPGEKASETVAVFQIKPCYDPEYHKVTLVAQNVHVRAAFVKAMNSVNDVRHYTAPAPASGQEDELQKWIEKLETMGEM